MQNDLKTSNYILETGSSYITIKGSGLKTHLISATIMG